MTMILVLLCSLLSISSAQQQQSSTGCSFQSSRSPYTLNWVVDPSSQNVFFNLTYRNFPQGSFTGVGFGDNMASGIDAILVTLPSGISTPQVVDTSVKGYAQPTRDSNSEVQTRTTSWIGGNLYAQFIRPLNVDKSLSGCVMWNFITSPGAAFANGTYAKHSAIPEQQQQCNIAIRCAGTIPAQYINTPNSGAWSSGQNNNQQYSPYPNQYQQQQYGQNGQRNYNQQPFQTQQYNQRPYSTNQQFNQQPYQNQPFPQRYPNQIGNGVGMQPTSYYNPYSNQQNSSPNYNSQQQYGRKKRQTGTNIYGYNTDSNAASNPLIVQNPNYQFLPNYLADEYARTYSQASAQYEARNGGVNGAQRDPSFNQATQAPVLTNQQQNQKNYQQIQRDSASGAYSTIAPATNIYGYNYNTPSTSGSSSVNQVFLDPTTGRTTNGNNNNNGVFYASANRGPQPGQIVYYDTQSVGRKKRSIALIREKRQVHFYDPGNNQSAMYYPYRTETDFNLNAGQQGFSQVGGTPQYSNVNGVNGGVNPGSQRYYDTSRGVYVDGVPQFDSRGGNQYLKTAPVNPQSPNFVQTLQNNARALNDYVDPSCSKQDPYWCQSYVSQVMQAQNSFGSYTAGTCNTLVASLQYSDNRCCNAVRAAGCQI